MVVCCGNNRKLRAMSTVSEAQKETRENLALRFAFCIRQIT